MNEYVINVKFSEVQKALSEINDKVNQLVKIVKPEEDLWDGSDIIRNWNVSPRTLAEWRNKHLIEYVQINNKIYYSRSARENFLKENTVKSDYKGRGGMNNE